VISFVLMYVVEIRHRRRVGGSSANWRISEVGGGK